MLRTTLNAREMANCKRNKLVRWKILKPNSKLCAQCMQCAQHLYYSSNCSTMCTYQAKDEGEKASATDDLHTRVADASASYSKMVCAEKQHVATQGEVPRLSPNLQAHYTMGRLKCLHHQTQILDHTHHTQVAVSSCGSC